MFSNKLSPIYDLNRFLGDVFEHGGFLSDMPVDLYQEQDALVAEIPLAGMKAKDVDVNVCGDVLRIKGHREEESEKKGKNYFHKEIRTGSFERTVNLPMPVSSENVKASFSNGILKVTMPLKTASKSVNIKVEE